MARNYTAERLRESKARKTARKVRGRARTKVGLKVGDSRVVGHKKPLSKGGSNSGANLRVENRTKSNKEGGRRQPKAAKKKGGRNSRSKR